MKRRRLRWAKQVERITKYLYGDKHYSRDHQLWGHIIVSQNFMEPEGSMPNLQELSICSYP
jgi:hypothetical protein